MAITEIIKNKKYQVIVSYRDPFGEPRNKKKIVNGTEKDARKIESSMSEELDKGFDPDINYSALLTKYLDTRINVKEETNRKDREVFKKYFSILGNKKVKGLVPFDLISLRGFIENQGGSITQMNRAIFLFKRLSKFSNLYFGFNDYSQHLELFKPKVKEKFVYSTYTPEEFNYVNSFVTGENYKLLYEVYYWSGLRRGEALALTPRDVLPTMEINVNKSLNSFSELGAPKNEQSYRKVKIHEPLYKKIKKYSNSKNTNLFGGMRALPPSTVNGRFSRAILRANKKRIEQGLYELPHIRIHDLRHSHVTFLASQGVPITAISARVGHSSINETMSTYMHLFKGDDDKVVDVISQYLSEV